MAASPSTPFVVKKLNQQNGAAEAPPGSPVYVLNFGDAQNAQQQQQQQQQQQVAPHSPEGEAQRRETLQRLKGQNAAIIPPSEDAQQIARNAAAAQLEKERLGAANAAKIAGGVAPPPAAAPPSAWGLITGIGKGIATSVAASLVWQYGLGSFMQNIFGSTGSTLAMMGIGLTWPLLKKAMDGYFSSSKESEADKIIAAAKKKSALGQLSEQQMSALNTVMTQYREVEKQLKTMTESIPTTGAAAVQHLTQAQADAIAGLANRMETLQAQAKSIIGIKHEDDAMVNGIMQQAYKAAGKDEAAKKELDRIKSASRKSSEASRDGAEMAQKTIAADQLKRALVAPAPAPPVANNPASAQMKASAAALANNIVQDVAANPRIPALQQQPPPMIMQQPPPPPVIMQQQPPPPQVITAPPPAVQPMVVPQQTFLPPSVTQYPAPSSPYARKMQSKLPSPPKKLPIGPPLRGTGLSSTPGPRPKPKSTKSSVGRRTASPTTRRKAAVAARPKPARLPPKGGSRAALPKKKPLPRKSLGPPRKAKAAGTRK